MPELSLLQYRSVAGAVAGNLTVTGIKKGDRIIGVTPVSAVGANLASEFTATADNTINNTGGTSTAGVAVLLVVWEKGTGTVGGRSGERSVGTGRLSY